MQDWLQKGVDATGLGEPGVTGISYMILIAAVALLSWGVATVTRRLILRIVSRLIRSTETHWDDRLLESGFFRYLGRIGPGLVIFLTAPAFGPAQDWLERLSMAYIIVVAVQVLSAALDATLAIYQSYESSRQRPIRGYIQLGRIILYLLGAIFVLSILMQREPWGLLTGLGAMSAVLLLVFRDSILGLVASVQLTSNDMVRRGDWLEMPKYGADGDVVDVSLHTVKIQNWDKTITTIPTQALINDAFKNWRGMQESGGRRIKRAIHIDISTIRLCDESMLRRFEKIEHIRDYIREKREETESFNREHGIDTSDLVNGRRLTNIGTFRAYVQRYLHAHPKIHDDMTFLVRQLAPSEKGLPIEIYVFSNDQVWAHYEAIQADIFDHILAVVPEFDLRVYQSPSANDLLGAAREITLRGAASTAQS